MRYALAVAATLISLAPQIAAAQSEPGHVYSIQSFKAHTGSEGDYSQSYWEVLRPVFDHARSQGAIVSYLDLFKQAGDLAEGTHAVIVEYEDWEAYANFQQALEAASQAVFGRPFAETQGNAFVPLREPLGTELFIAPPGGM